MSENDMHVVACMKYLPKLKGIIMKLCAHSFPVKQHRVAFHTLSPHRAENAIDIVHTNVCFMTENSHGGAMYFVNLIDEHSKKYFSTC